MEVFQELKLLRVGSKFKKMKQPPLRQIEDDDGFAIDGAARDQAWFKHCATLEAGVQTSTQRLLQRIRKGSYARAAQFPERNLTEAPTLLDLERSFRRIRKAKAPGHDGLRSDLCSLVPVEMSKLYFPVLAKMFFRSMSPSSPRVEWWLLPLKAASKIRSTTSEACFWVRILERLYAAQSVNSCRSTTPGRPRIYMSPLRLGAVCATHHTRFVRINQLLDNVAGVQEFYFLMWKQHIIVLSGN